ncbi:MAG: helix-turn-helix domain-containing protein [Actinobacteria bacterium]|nr:helix-turn-helix domain-containing protein [Actinomycetota bacterium]MBU2687174.1 helix-turn-helix domain-containing protein [Actinomycetota bacterium]
MIYREIGKRIQKAREEAGLSQEELASALGITQSALSNYELGKRRLYLANLEQLAGVLERPLGYFMEEERPAGPGRGRQEESSDEVTSEILRLLPEFSPGERAELLDYMKWRRDRSR